MSPRIVLVLLVITLISGCGPSSSPAPAVSVSPVDAQPAGALMVTSVPAAAANDCDREASLRPGPLPQPGVMPPGSTMAAIADRGRLIVGVDQDSYPFGSRNPTTGELEGFDIGLAHEIARAIFGDPNRIELKVINPSQRESELQQGKVDLVVRTYSITCARAEKVAFSSTYYVANQKVLVTKGSGIDSPAALSDRRVCSVNGTTSLPALFELNPAPTVIGVSSWTDCLVMLQQGQVDAVSTDDAVLAGLAVQDPNLAVVGASMGLEPYGVGVNKANEDLVRFVNGVLAQIRADGTWERLYDNNLRSLGPSPGPPVARYRD
ncbi:MAG: glutamate ABC transporter substrate-binding protein [Mycobacterium sp.]